jgi:hypothetical protein
VDIRAPRFDDGAQWSLHALLECCSLFYNGLSD